jgi:hypothetical protein
MAEDNDAVKPKKENKSKGKKKAPVISDKASASDAVMNNDAGS